MREPDRDEEREPDRLLLPPRLPLPPPPPERDEPPPDRLLERELDPPRDDACRLLRMPPPEPDRVDDPPREPPPLRPPEPREPPEFPLLLPLGIQVSFANNPFGVRLPIRANTG